MSVVLSIMFFNQACRGRHRPVAMGGGFQSFESSAAARARLKDLGITDSWAEHVLRMAQRLQWLLLIVPALAIILMVRMPLTPQILFKPTFTFAWVVLLLNIFPLTAGYLLLAVTKPTAIPVTTERATPDDASTADNPDPTPDLETQTQKP